MEFRYYLGIASAIGNGHCRIFDEADFNQYPDASFVLFVTVEFGRVHSECGECLRNCTRGMVVANDNLRFTTFLDEFEWRRIVRSDQ